MVDIKIVEHVVQELPSERPLVTGHKYKVVQGNGDLLEYVIDSNGEPVFVRGITEDQNNRLQQVTQQLIDKLSNDYTKAEIDQQFEDVRNFANSSRINLNGTTVLPVPPRRPDNTVIEDAWVRLAQNVTYTQAGGSPLTGIDGHETVAEWNNEDGEWVLVDMGELPINPVDGEVAEGDNRAVSGDAVYKSLQPISNYIEGLSVNGVIYNAGYNLENTSEYTRINILNNVEEDGVVDKIIVNVSKIGDLKVCYLSRTSSTQYKIEKLIDVTISSLGVNELVDGDDFTDVKVQKGWYLGFIIPTGGANPKYISKTAASVSSATNTSSEGDTVTVSSSNSEWAIGSIIKSDSLDEIITDKVGISDLSIVETDNLAKVSYFIPGMYINNSTGAKVFAAGWGVYRIVIESGNTNISFGNFNITTGGNAAFFDKNENPTVAGTGNLVSFAGTYTDANLPKTYTVPPSIVENGGILYITVKRPIDDRTRSINTMVNYGNTLLPYVQPEFIDKIRGIPLEQSSSLTTINRSLEYMSKRKATFSFIFDDLNSSDTLVYNIFKEYDFRPSFAIKTSNLTPSNSQTYVDFYNDGCAILSHSVTHPAMNNPLNITYQQVTDELVNSKKALLDLGIPISGFVTPQSVMHSSFLPIAEKVYGYSFTNLNAGGFTESVEPNRMARYGIEGTDIAGNSLQMIKDRIDLAITNNELVNFYAHKLPSTTLDINNDSYLTEEKLREILNYLKGKADNFDCIVLNTDDAIKMYYSPTWSEIFN